MNSKEDTYTLVVCRGASTQYVIDNISLVERSSNIIQVNSWGDDKPSFFFENTRKLTIFSNAKITTSPQLLGKISCSACDAKIIFARSWHDMASFYNIENNLYYISLKSTGLIDIVKEAWGYHDAGLNSIFHSAGLSKRIVITGFDLWESPYLSCIGAAETRIDPGWTNEKISRRDRRNAGKEIKFKILDFLFEFMRKWNYTTFHFYTLSKTLYERQKEEKLPNVTVELIEKSQ